MYEYNVIYSNRKSISVAVSSENKIVVRCPLNCSHEKIEKFLADKSVWINRIIQKNDKKISLNKDILRFDKVYVNGEKFPLICNAQRNCITDNGVFVSNLKKLSVIFEKTFSQIFIEHVKNIGYHINIIPTSVRVKDYKSRWGCCDGNNNIMFNYKLFMLPQNLQEYVIIHELCHIKIHNHSYEFWRLVENYYPQYKICRHELKNYDFLTRLY